MPVIDCPECDGSVSSFAVACPHCGLPSNRFGLDLLRSDRETTATSHPAVAIAHVFGEVEGIEDWDGIDFEELWISPPAAGRGKFLPLAGPNKEQGCALTVSRLRSIEDFWDDDEADYYFPHADPCPSCERILALWRQSKTDGRVGWWTESGDPVGKADDWSNEENLEVTPPPKPVIEIDWDVARVREVRRQKIAKDLAKNERALRSDQ